MVTIKLTIRGGNHLELQTDASLHEARPVFAPIIDQWFTAIAVTPAELSPLTASLNEKAADLTAAVEGASEHGESHP